MWWYDMKIAIDSDHRGYKLKELIKEEYKNPNVKFIDYGTDTEEITDYPDYAFILGEKVVSKEVDFGVAICGSGIGIGIACNKVKGIRCATVKTVEDVKKIGLNPSDNIGKSKNHIVQAYRGKGECKKPTDEQVERLKELGISLEKKRRTRKEIAEASISSLKDIEIADEEDKALKELAEKTKEGGILISE